MDPFKSWEFSSNAEANRLNAAFSELQKTGGSVTVRPGNVTMFMGDSITANGTNSYAPATFEGRAWYAQACLLSDSRITFGGVAATAGYTTAQILATHLPAVVAAKPANCVVLAGRNDVVVSVPLATTIANLTAIYTGLTNAGILPIPCTLTAQSGNTAAQSLLSSQISQFIRQYAAANRLPLLDLATYTTDPATDGQVAGWFADASHPNPAGARNIATYVNATLAPWLPPYTPPIALANTTPTTSTNLIANPLLLTDTNADGVPDNFTLVAGTATGTVALAPGTGPIRGNAMTITRTGGTGIYYVKMTASAPMTTGRRLALSFRASTSGVESSGGNIFVRTIEPNGTLSIAGLSSFTADLPAPGGMFYEEFVMPAGYTGINLWAGVSAGNCSVTVSQLSLRDIT